MSGNQSTGSRSGARARTVFDLTSELECTAKQLLNRLTLSHSPPPEAYHMVAHSTREVEGGPYRRSEAGAVDSWR